LTAVHPIEAQSFQPSSATWSDIVRQIECRFVQHAIPAENLWTALRSAGAETAVRVPDATDQRAEEAMAAVRAKYEAQLASVSAEAERM
jgi:hypothetical protein